MDQTLPPKLDIRRDVPFEDPTIAKVAYSLGIKHNSASRVHDGAPWRSVFPRPVPNFWLVKVKEDTPQDKSIGYTIDGTKVSTCVTNKFKDALGVVQYWTVEGYFIREDQLEELTGRCAGRLDFIAGGYDELVEYTAGQDPEEPRVDNETGMGMSVYCKLL